MMPIFRHVIQALTLASICHILIIYTIDSPQPIYHCPLDTHHGLSSHNGNGWTDENCYWSTSYPEAREKFVSLGNRIKEQVRLAQDNDGTAAMDVLDVQSLSYDIAGRADDGDDYPAYIKSLTPLDASSSQSPLPGKDTIDALLLTVRIPETSAGDDDGTNEENNENVNVIHSSGTHGVEGYLGSAVQIRFLHELFMQNEEQLEKRKTIQQQQQHEQRVDDATIPASPGGGKARKLLLIHSVNPHGMRHHRRTNENNVDLNRNVLSDEKWTEIRKRDPNFVGYVDMDTGLNPFKALENARHNDDTVFSWVEAAKMGGYDGDTTKLIERDEKVKNTVYESHRNAPTSLKEPITLTNAINSWLDEKKSILRVFKETLVYILTKGFTNAKRTLVTAQYHKPTGIFYGGGAHNNNQWENSILAVQHAINDFAGFHQFESPSSRSLWVDVHTGLGKFGDYSILEKLPKQYTASNAWAFQFTSRLESSNMGYGQSSDAAVSAGYDQTIGFLHDELLCPPPHCFAMAQEFGTRPGIAVAVALVLENAGHQSMGGRYGHLTSWAFYPQRLSWRRKTIRGGMDMLRAALEF